MRKIKLSGKLLCLVSVILTLGGLTVNIQASEKILPAISRTEVLLPSDSDELAWRYNVKMAAFTGGCSCFVYELNTPELIKWRIAEMKKEGLNTIMLNGLHMHLCLLERWSEIVEYVKTLTLLAHENGMKVIFHHDVPIVHNNGTGLNYVIEHIDWLQRDIQYDRPAFNRFCFNNPEFRKSYFDRVEDLVRKTDIDGVKLDEVTFIDKEYCGCRYCRERFTMETGLILPTENNSSVLFNQKNPIWIAWLNWRKRSVGDWWVDMRKRFNIVKPDFCIMIYSTHYGFTSNWATNNLGFDLLQSARGCDFLGTEIMTRNVYDSYRAVYAYRKAKAGLGDFYGSPVYGLVYHLNDPVYAYFGWAMNHMNRQTTLMSTIVGEKSSHYLDWNEKMNCRYAKPMSDIAIVFSGNARDFGGILPYMPDVFGTSQCLSDAHIQHDIIMQGDLLNGLKLSQYKLLMLTCLGNMSEKEVQAVRQYVAMGGTLFVSGHTSLLNESGFEQPDFQLADVMGVDALKGRLYKAPTTILMNADGKTLTIPYSAVKVKLRKDAKIIAEIINKEQKPIVPAIVSNTYGKGQCLYSALPLGILNNQPEYRYGKKMEFEKNQAVCDFYMSLVKDITHDNLDFKGIDIPEKVLVNVCKQNVKDKKEVLVHLLNATGTGVKKGDIIPGKSDWKKRGNPFPPLERDIVFDIRPGGNVSSAVIVSPDYKGERPVKLEKLDNGYLKVTVKKEDLQAYSIVYLELLNN
ncbi:MAG: hypothetical protein A2017_01810 [Lentisphaerae bacterium GWF2_44_16]|nr:MAG: hypothetical protein A2017_01810 [Lentisphaerae bacterium GWF2_44_16]